jgi:hypothetical protein
MIGEYVVKLRGTVGAPGLLKEMIASRLAYHFGLESPEPATAGCATASNRCSAEGG